MKRRALILCGCLLALAGALADDSALTREWLEKNYFQSIAAAADGIVVRFRESGERFACTRNGTTEPIPEYGARLSIKLGDKFELHSRHSSLEFTPLPSPMEKRGFLLSSLFDARSFGGEEQIHYAIVLLPPGGAELQFIAPLRGFDPALPPTDPTYQSILKMIPETAELAEHALVAESSAGELKPPFPASSTSLHFRWKKKSGDPAPVEIRWVAVEVENVPEKNRVIVSSQSQPAQASGDFVLKQPAAGFPPGKYRVEIREAGKIIYSEPFEIKR